MYGPIAELEVTVINASETASSLSSRADLPAAEASAAACGSSAAERGPRGQLQQLEAEPEAQRKAAQTAFSVHTRSELEGLWDRAAIWRFSGPRATGIFKLLYWFFMLGRLHMRCWRPAMPKSGPAEWGTHSGPIPTPELEAAAQ